MTSVVEQERSTYREMFGVAEYLVNSPGVRYLPAFQQWAPAGSTVLDAGCGPGAGSAALMDAGYRVALCDLEPYGDYPRELFAPACLWSESDVQNVAYEMRLRSFMDTERFDYVYCCDVLEHLPPVFTMLAVRNLLSIVECGIFLSIAFMPDGHGVWVGKHLHQTVQPFTTWRDQLNEVGNVVDARDLALAGLFFVEPRR